MKNKPTPSFSVAKQSISYLLTPVVFMFLMMSLHAFGSSPDNSEFVINASATPSLICSGETSQLVVTASGGSGIYTFLWSPAAVISGPADIADPVAVPVTTTTYSVTVSDGTDERVTNVTVEVNYVIPGTIGYNQLVCFNGDPAPLIELSPASAAGTLTYQWQKSEGMVGSFSTISGATDISYDPPAVTAETFFRRRAVSILNGVTCRTPGNIIRISMNPQIIVTPSTEQNVVCLGSTIHLVGLASGGSGSGASYNWSGPAGFVSAIKNPDLPNAQVYNTGTYTLTVTDDNNCSGSATVSVQVIPFTGPIIQSQPSNQTGMEGDTITFTVASAGCTLNYQWQVSSDNGVTFTNVGSEDPFSGDTLPTLTINGISSLMNGFLFRCLVSGSNPPGVLTNAALLTAGETIITSLGKIFACPGSTVTVPLNVEKMVGARSFTLTFNYDPSAIAFLTFTDVNPQLLPGFSLTPGPGEIKVQWTGSTPQNITNGLICNLNFAFVQQSDLEFSLLTPDNCVFKGNEGINLPAAFHNGSVTDASPAIITQPADRLGVVNEPVSFRIISSGLPSFQWQLSTDNGDSWGNISNSAIYAGVYTDTLFIVTTAVSMDGYQYRCMLTGCNTTVYSDAAILTVINVVETWIDNQYNCLCAQPANDILVPVKVSSFNDISSVSLSLFYKKSGLQYDGIAWIHQDIPAPMFNNIEDGEYGNIRFAAYSAEGSFSIPDNEAIFVLKFKVLCDTTRLQWETWIPGACQYSSGLSTFNSVFTDGYSLDNELTINGQPADVTVDEGETASFITMGTTLGLAPVTFKWQEKTPAGEWTDLIGSPVYGGVDMPVLTVVGTPSMSGNLYRCLLSDGCHSVFTDPALLTVQAGYIEGFVTYDNIEGTPMPNTTVMLKQGGNIVYQTTTDASGFYHFVNPAFGDYQIEATTTLPWGGVNAADALRILTHFVGLDLLSGLPLLAADVNNVYNVNSTDALMVANRFVGAINSFPAGDWLFENGDVSLTAHTTVTFNIRGLCFGDVNQSYIPGK